MKKVDHICGNCMLYNKNKNECRVVILHNGEKLHLPVVASDTCFFEGQFRAIDGKEFVPADDIKEVKFWVDNPDKNGNGVVKVEYPEEFFGAKSKD